MESAALSLRHGAADADCGRALSCNEIDNAEIYCAGPRDLDDAIQSVAYRFGR